MPTTIIGVDFSGAWANKNTWVAKGNLNSDGKLVLCNAQSIRRYDLLTLLANVKMPAVVAMDFPFGVPSDFATYICPNAKKMSDVWENVSEVHAEEFIATRHRFMNGQTRQPKRAGDKKYHKESKSPLHIGNPLMLAMTYAGMYLLHHLHQERPRRWHVPPLQSRSDAAPQDVVTLLEVMPGAFLKDVGLPYEKYKGRDLQSLQRRKLILDELAKLAYQWRISHLDLLQVREGCLNSHDCLDSVVAAVAAAAWKQNCQQFRHPNADELSDAQLEGWIYAPLPPPQQPNQPNR